MERDPSKRQIKPALSFFADFEDVDESSSDSDFRIEDFDDTEDDSIDSDGEGNDDDNDDPDDDDDDNEFEEGEDVNKQSNSDGSNLIGKITTENVLDKVKNPKQITIKDSDKLKILICCMCLGDRSDATNEIVECDGCGVTVHEACYGISEADSVSSTESSCSTMPWFCEACRAGVNNLNCELCPNSGGIYKETDVGKWVHLVCALYVPAVAFGEVDKLSNITLFEMAYSKWGSKACQLCTDKRLARTGVVIGCDAGMCRAYFHVTCGLSNGLLAEAHSEEADQADPFYAHCKLHSDKTLVKKKRRNWLALQSRIRHYKEKSLIEMHMNSEQQLRTQRKLNKYKVKYLAAKKNKLQPWVPTQKMGRALTTCASACRALWRKAELSGVDMEAWEIREAQVAALADVHRKWHIPPAFSVEYIAYYLDRNLRVGTMRRQLAQLLDENAKLVEEQQALQEKYNKAVDDSNREIDVNKSLKEKIQVYHSFILKVLPNKVLPNLDMMGRKPNPVPRPAPTGQVTQVSRNHPLATPSGGVPTAAALKAGVGFPLGLFPSGIQNRACLSRSDIKLNNECGICKKTNDQHLLAKCDTCHLYYHLGCLTPPLTRMPKKNKIMGWQCSECDKESSGSEVECIDTEAPRKLRNVKDNGDNSKGSISLDNEKDLSLNESNPEVIEIDSSPVKEEPIDVDVEINREVQISGRQSKKRRREKHHRYSPEPLSSGGSRPHKRKHKRKCVEINSDNEPRQPLKICFKSIPHPTGEGSAYVATPSQGVTRTSTPLASTYVAVPHTPSQTQIVTPNQSFSSIDITPPIRTLAAKKKEEPTLLCSTCSSFGTNSNIVRCDECLKGFHFHCLDPPVKKSPKVRGYSWHCADCDPTESDSN